MAKVKKLTRRQNALIEDLFTHDEEEQVLLDKHNVSSRLYCRWLVDEAFAEQLDRQVKVAYHRSKLLLARKAVLVASRLVDLTGCDKKETARKACLDIICTTGSIGQTSAAATPERRSEDSMSISPQAAGRLLAAIAQEDGGR